MLYYYYIVIVTRCEFISLTHTKSWGKQPRLMWQLCGFAGTQASVTSSFENLTSTFKHIFRNLTWNITMSQDDYWSSSYTSLF